jgi:DNA-binding ferritin-like protein
MLGPRERFYESVGGHEDPLAERIRQITESPDLDHYAEQKARDLLQTLGAIREFRDQLHNAFVENLVRLASTMSREVQAFVRSVTGLAAQHALQEMLEALNDRGEDIQSP